MNSIEQARNRINAVAEATEAAHGENLRRYSLAFQNEALGLDSLSPSLTKRERAKFYNELLRNWDLLPKDDRRTKLEEWRTNNHPMAKTIENAYQYLAKHPKGSKRWLPITIVFGATSLITALTIFTSPRAPQETQLHSLPVLPSPPISYPIREFLPTAIPTKIPAPTEIPLVTVPNAGGLPDPITIQYAQKVGEAKIKLKQASINAIDHAAKILKAGGVEVEESILASLKSEAEQKVDTEQTSLESKVNTYQIQNLDNFESEIKTQAEMMSETLKEEALDLLGREKLAESFEMPVLDGQGDSYVILDSFKQQGFDVDRFDDINKHLALDRMFKGFNLISGQHVEPITAYEWLDRYALTARVADTQALMYFKELGFLSTIENNKLDSLLKRLIAGDKSAKEEIIQLLGNNPIFSRELINQALEGDINKLLAILRWRYPGFLKVPNWSLQALY